jgi:hypothetical protein
VATVVIPAHNESRVIGRLLGQLVQAGSSRKLDVIVIANGCSDDTVRIASAFGQRVRVLDVPAASKHGALAVGDGAATGFPRVYIDADVEIGASDVEALVAELGTPGVLAAAPARVVTLDGCPWPVRWYYDVWMRLPQVRDGLFGRGVIAVNEAGHGRMAGLPPLLSDDLAASLLFAPEERRIAARAQVVCHPPRTVADLVRRRIRIATGVTQLERSQDALPSTARTGPADLLGIAARRPAAAPKVLVFLAVTVIARLAARRAVARGDFATWQRDESSRRPARPGGAATAREGK